MHATVGCAASADAWWEVSATRHPHCKGLSAHDDALLLMVSLSLQICAHAEATDAI